MTEYNNGTEYREEDIERNKTMAALAYIMFFLPLIASPDSDYGRFHANQGLLLLILSIVGNWVLRFIPFIGKILSFLLSVFILVFIIKGIMNGLNGKIEEIPLIGHIRIIK